jgi:hypothetical protein
LDGLTRLKRAKFRRKKLLEFISRIFIKKCQNKKKSRGLVRESGAPERGMNMGAGEEDDGVI